ncbi:hypothetical protein AB0E67_21870 [Streptomyces sp. NPDC032161]|uniref:hypothetical protein n=1 Tax=unclassified Streptomyces TaxID=2593676 RepID=UPI0033D2C7B2
MGDEPRDGRGLELGEPGVDFIPLGGLVLELGDLALEPFDLRGPWVDALAGLLESRKAPLALLGKVLVAPLAGLWRPGSSWGRSRSG